jgi:hypothetical protein
MNITRTSWVSGEVNTLDLPITQEQLDLYAAGALLQDAFPNLTPDEREFIKSGITAEEWDSLFGGDEEEEQEKEVSEWHAFDREIRPYDLGD